MTIGRFSKEQRILPVDGKRWLVHLHRRWREGGGAVAALVVKPPKGIKIAPYGDPDKGPRMQATLFGERRPFTTTLAEVRAAAGKPSWRLFWEPRPLHLTPKGHVFDGVLIARALACVDAAPNSHVRVAIRTASPDDRREGYAAATLLIIGDGWRAAVASRTPKVDRKPMLWQPKRVSPRAITTGKGK